MFEKNPYDPNSPEWQLFANMQSNALLQSTHMADAERSMRKAEEARHKAELYRVALEKLAKEGAA